MEAVLEVEVTFKLHPCCYTIEIVSTLLTMNRFSAHKRSYLKVKKGGCLDQYTL